MNSRRLFASGVGVIALLVAGCGSGTESSSDSQSAAPSNNAATCALAPETTVNQQLGTLYSAPAEEDRGSVVICNYTAPVDGSTGIVRFETDTDTLELVKAGFDTSGQTVTDIPSVGDEAFSSTAGTGQYRVNTVVVRKGNKNVQIVSAASTDLELELAKLLIGKF